MGTKDLFWGDTRPDDYWLNRDACMLFDVQSKRAFAVYGYKGNMQRVLRLLREK